MADQEGKEQSAPMQDSWVDVQGGEGKLVHNRSKEELEKLIASAVSEEEPEMSDSDTMYQVSFKPCESPQDDDGDQSEESPTTSPLTNDPPQLPIAPVSAITQTKPQLMASARVPSGVGSQSPSSSCGTLLWCVPVLILTHLAIFGIGYYLGRRPPVEASPLKLLHV